MECPTEVHITVQQLKIKINKTKYFSCKMVLTYWKAHKSLPEMTDTSSTTE